MWFEDTTITQVYIKAQELRPWPSLELRPPSKDERRAWVRDYPTQEMMHSPYPKQKLLSNDQSGGCHCMSALDRSLKRSILTFEPSYCYYPSWANGWFNAYLHVCKWRCFWCFKHPDSFPDCKLAPKWKLDIVLQMQLASFQKYWNQDFQLTTDLGVVWGHALIALCWNHILQYGYFRTHHHGNWFSFSLLRNMELITQLTRTEMMSTE